MKLLLLILACLQLAYGVKLKIKHKECLSHHFEMYEPFYGSFVSLPDVYHHTANMDLEITAPSGTKVHEAYSTQENKFHLVPYETGNYKFCLTLSPHQHTRYYTIERDVIWELYVGHADHSSDHAKEQDTQSLWHYDIGVIQNGYPTQPVARMQTLCCPVESNVAAKVTMVDAQLQQLRSTVSYLYWRERRHRMTVDSTNARVLWYAILRASGLVIVSILQVLGIRYLFRSK